MRYLNPVAVGCLAGYLQGQSPVIPRLLADVSEDKNAFGNRFTGVEKELCYTKLIEGKWIEKMAK
jgi:hypothetical protein